MKKEDVDKLSVQEALDYAVSAIVRQGGRCVSISGACLYAGNVELSEAEGHCGIGHLLDETDERLMSFVGGIGLLTQTYPNKVPRMIREAQEDLSVSSVFSCFQRFHDEPDKAHRLSAVKSLNRIHSIDTLTNPDWDNWVNMAKPHGG